VGAAQSTLQDKTLRSTVMGPRRKAAAAAVTVLLVTCLATADASARSITFAAAGQQAVATLLQTYYTNGVWRNCNAADCGTGNQDWGNDSLTFALSLRYQATHDPSLQTPLNALATTATGYGAPCADVSGCDGWSDVPNWDAIALADEYLATGNQEALAKAEAAYTYVEQSSAYALGACARIRYQQPGGGGNQLKTLETDANAIKAALLLYRATGQAGYLAAAQDHYASVRAYFLDPHVPLYTVYVVDDGRACTQIPHRFFASVNGDMIWSGLELFDRTHDRGYLNEAIATGRAVDQDLADGRGVFVDLQAENDIVEPLVEAMYGLALEGQSFARGWIVRNASAALGARTPDGSFGRFFDGPPPVSTVTDWQTNGGLALEIAAAALAPNAAIDFKAPWAGARTVSDDIASLPAKLTFKGAGIALIGTLGEQCCEPGHARVLIDGVETFDQTGIWQNKSSSGRSIPNSVLFAWRWRAVGTHTLTFDPGAYDAKEGGAFLHLVAYEVLPRACPTRHC
jgi:hypothetical protein